MSLLEICHHLCRPFGGQKKGYWENAHELAQSAGSVEGDWVHAYLHREEGDLGNAAYWYARAGKPVCRSSLSVEWEEMVKELLK